MERGRERAAEQVERARERAVERVERARLTFRRLSGLDRSGPPPPETLPGAPLRPWTIPNAIGYVRLALIPAFVAVGLADEDGVDAVAATLFAVVAWSDYLDGIAARVTGQYSRLGALMDPLIDRMLVISGFVVAWVHDLLPRWAIAALAVREALMLIAARWWLRHQLEIRINWWGRLAVWPTMAALFAGLVGLDDTGAILLYVGLVMSWVAFLLYVRFGLEQLRARKASTST